MSIHPAEYAKMTPIQRKLAKKLESRHWHFAMLYYRSCYFLPKIKLVWPDGSVHRSEAWNRKGIKVLPSGKIMTSGK